VRIFGRPMNSTDPAIEEGRRAGFDMDMLDTNLTLTLDERMLQHDSALELALEMRAAGAAMYAQTAFVAPAPR
jgi:hypothetical protein